MIIDQYFKHIHSRGVRAQAHLLKLAALLLAVSFIGMLFSPHRLQYLARATGSMIFLYPFGLGCRSMMEKFGTLLDRCGDACKTTVLLTVMNAFNFVMGLIFIFAFSTRSFEIEVAFFVLFLLILVSTIFSLTFARQITKCHMIYNPVITIIAIFFHVLIVGFAYMFKMSTYGGDLLLRDDVEYWLVVTLYIICFFCSMVDLLAIAIGELVFGDNFPIHIPIRFGPRRDSIELEETVHGPMELLDVVSLQERFQRLPYQRPITLM